MEEALVRRIPPHSLEAEKSVIGSMLMGKEAVMTAVEILDKEDFYERSYGLIFDAMRELAEEGRPVDVITLEDRLKEKDVPPEIADMSFVRDTLAAVPTSANVRYYANIVAEKALLRRIIRVTSDIENDCYLGKSDIGEILEKTERTVFGVLQQKSTGEYVPIRDVVLAALTRIEEASRSKGHVTGLPTGFIDLDNKTSGLQKSDFILIAARPSMGKTAFVLNIAEYMAFRQNIPCAIFSLEMSKDQLMNRLFALESRVNAQALRTGNLKDDEWEKLVEGAGVISNSHLIIDDTPGINLQEFRSRARKYKLDHDIQIIFIDYLQLMAGNGGRSDNRQQEISDISRALKSLARELNIPIVALSQLNRAVETRDDHRPMLSDLRESGAIEQDADVVMFIYRDDYYHKDTEEKGVAEIIIAKQRNGPIGTVKLVWLPEYTKFANMRGRGDRVAPEPKD
ncbi:MAG: replicative DNA helicase [Lachnospiraceae bacterium]|jgi:replicative DNA helicase|nr:replicative DNA helicase [Lachnospiraceae bacterium]